jgi:pimeloyl-ACP methyl ester carboxylesterase
VASLAHERHGAGEPLVLVHGLGSRRGAWAPVIPALVAARDLVAVDLPGFGDSPADGGEMTVPALARRLQGFFDELSLQRPHVAGNSLGGAVALELGRRGAARSVTAFSPIGFWSAAERAWGMGALTAGRALGRRRVPGLPERVEARLTRPISFVFAYGNPWRVPDAEIVAMSMAARSSASFAEAVRASRDHAFERPEELRGLALTIAWGRRDVLVPYWTCSRRASRMLPWGVHVTLPGCGHVPFFDDPEACARVLLEGSGG